MPIYEYVCKNCNNRFDILAFSTSENTAKCPKCGSDETNKIISPLGYMKHPDDSGNGKPSSVSSCETGGCCTGGCNTAKKD
ncbi:MAG: zinc ribbon domain-containing protein [Caldisericia bacterium]|nr:zinc ribbon domain-containing protein [Caldisericia bacterium]